VADASAPELVVEEATVQAGNDDGSGEDADDGSGPRRGWWQRTFG